MPSWWLDELEHAGAEHLDPDYVSRYERKAGYDPAGDVMALAEYGMSDGAKLIDFGAGTGQFAIAAAGAGAQVVAVDCSPEMVSAMRSKKEGAADFEIVEAGLLSYEHEGGQVDFAFSRNALHQIPDFWKGIALDRVRSCLKEGGILLLKDIVFDCEPRETTDAIEKWMSGAVADSKLGFTAEDLAEHVRTEFSTYSWIMEPLIERAGFQILRRDYRRRAYATYICRAA